MLKLVAVNGKHAVRCYTLTVSDLHPAHPAFTARLMGSARSIVIDAANMILEQAEARGVAPTALDWSLKVAS